MFGIILKVIKKSNKKYLKKYISSPIRFFATWPWTKPYLSEKGHTIISAEGHHIYKVPLYPILFKTFQL